VDSHGGDDARLVEAARGGDDRAFGELFDRWFDSVYDVAWRIVRDRDTAAEVAQDVFLAAWQGLGSLEQPGSFGGWVRRIARNRALNRLDRERRSRPDAAAAEAALDRTAADVDMTAVLGEREQRELVWAASAALGERDASLLDLHLRHGLGAADIAAELGVTANNAHQLLHRLKGRLAGAIRAWVLWRGGSPPCPDLDRAVADAGVGSFGADAVRVVDRHARGCERCQERQQLRLAPEALFAAVPVAVAPPALKVQAVAALTDAGVPMAGSSAAGAPAGIVAGPGAAEGSAPAGPAPGGHGAPTPETGRGASTGPGGGPTGAPDPADGTAPSPTRPDPEAVTPVDGTPPTGAADPPAIAAGPVAEVATVPPDAAPGEADGRRRRVLVLAGLGATIVAVGLAVVLTAGDDGDVATAPAGTTVAEATTSSVAPASGSTAPPDTAVASPGTEPGPDIGTAPPPEEPATETTPPSAVPPPETTTTVAPVPDPAPTIGGFRATPGSTVCDAATGATTVTLVWQSSDADSASVAGQSGLPASGTTSACAPSGTTFTLVVTGPGGSAQRSATVP
jgi:RNA polymerase sigma factor (sigma-70 family)